MHLLNRTWGVITILTLFLSVNPFSSGESNAFNQALLDSAVKEAKEWHENLLQEAMITGAQTVKPKYAIKKYTPESVRMGKLYNIYTKAEEILINKYHIDPQVAHKASVHARQAECPMEPQECDPNTKYRSITGQCNNPQNQFWGSTYQPLVRDIAPAYEGTNYEPRGGLRNSRLPPPRSISNIAHANSNSNSGGNSDVTHMVAQFGQFLDHDITSTPEENKACCLNGVPVINDPDCFAIEVTTTDPYYSCPNGEPSCTPKTCLSFTRSTPHCGVVDQREQMNVITAFVDGSNVYGSDPRLTKMLRKFENGLLEENSDVNGGFLPWRSDLDNDETEDNIVAGDFRANEMPALTTMHTLFLQEHNRIARELSQKVLWDDETLFQEARRLVIAEMQQITYAEYLPVTLGPAAMTNDGLELPDGFTSYNPTVNPTISNNFATAAYRFGHTLVNGLIQKFRVGSGTPTSDYLIKDNYFIPDQIIEVGTGSMPGYSEILNGLIRQEAQPSDAVLVDGLRNSLFKTVGDYLGTDLVARNIQRGRDHGTAGYNEFRVQCGLTRITSFAAKPAEIPQEAWDLIVEAYNVGTNPSVDDIDLYTGGLSEEPLPGAQTGPTFVCLMARQFKKLKDGDRFFFTHGNQAGSFTSEQLAQLRRRTLGDIICENSALQETQRNVFLPVSANNPMIPCQSPERQRLDMDVMIMGSSKSSPMITASIALVITLPLVKLLFFN